MNTLIAMEITYRKIKLTVKNIIEFVARPITVQPVFFLLIFLLLNILDLYSIIVAHGQSPLLKLASGFLLCYIVSCPVIIFPSLFRKLYKILVLVISVGLFLIDLYLVILYNETFRTLSPDVIAAMLVTNPAEAGEYLSTYLTIGKIVVLFGVISLLLFAFSILRKVQFSLRSSSKYVSFFFLVLSCLVCILCFNWTVFGNVYLLVTRTCPDLNEYRQNPTLSFKEEAPENIVFIIGESFSKMHSSLYGYDKHTNPKLEALRDSGALHVYDNVTSACLTTIPAIKSLMSGYVSNRIQKGSWYESLTLLEIMQKSGYEIFWVSTPVKYGIHENEVGRYADMCDGQTFVNDNKNDGGFLKDEELVHALDEYVEKKMGRKLYVVHMMGSHFSYSDRYPENFERLKPEDYIASHQNLSYKNRKILSEYDNSVIYNDSVVCEIMKKFENQDAVVVYLSDHGQDVFVSSDDYAGHPRRGNEVSERVGYEIPLMVYTTPLFREKHPQLQERIERSVSTPYRTDSIMYTIMDVAGVETVNGVSYKHKSLFR